MRPADLFEIPSDCWYLRWCFDEAVLYVGRWIDNRYEQRHKKGPRKGERIYTLEQILSDEKPKRVQSVAALLGLGGVEIR